MKCIIPASSNSSPLDTNPIFLKTNHLHRAVVCYGTKSENGKNQYLTAIEASQSGYTLDLVDNEAMNNMLYMEQQEDADWVPILTEVQGQSVTILTKTGSDLTASNILRSDILTDLQHYFETYLSVLKIVAGALLHLKLE